MEITDASEMPVHFRLTLQRHIPKVSSCLYRSQVLQFFLPYFRCPSLESPTLRFAITWMLFSNSLNTSKIFVIVLTAILSRSSAIGNNVLSVSKTAHQCDGNTNSLQLTFLNFWCRLLHQQAPRLQSPVMRRKICYYNSRRSNNDVTTCIWHQNIL